MAHPLQPLLRRLQSIVSFPHDLAELLYPTPVPYDPYPNIQIAYPGFLDWLTVFDARGSRGLERDLQAYRDLKRDHERTTGRMLDAIRLKYTGRALLGEINASKKFTAVIRPFTEWSTYGNNATASAADDAAATAEGMPLLDHITRGGRYVYKGHGTGGGSNVEVDFSMRMWGPDGTAHASGPGNEPDEVLYHELVHASRQMRGVAYDRQVNGHYDDEEEFVAVVVTNIYMSEKKQPTLRGSHGSAVLHHPEKFLDNDRLRPSPRHLLLRFWLLQPDLWTSLAQIGKDLTPFNPVRQLDAEVRAKAG